MKCEECKAKGSRIEMVNRIDLGCWQNERVYCRKCNGTGEVEPIKEVCEWEQKLRSFLEGLEMSNIDGLMTESVKNLKRVGELMAENIKSKIKGE